MVTGSVDAEAIVVGAGPNGLAAAVTLARAGLRVTVYERADQPGGGASTAELTLPGFHHDVCSAVHPLAIESPFFRAFELDRRIELLRTEISFAHPLDDRAVVAYRDLHRTADALGRDGAAYARLLGPLARRASQVAETTGSALLRMPRHPLTAARLAFGSAEQGTPLWNLRFREGSAPALLTGVSAHAILPLPSLAAAGAGLALTAYAHAKGWPIPVGGSQAIIGALVADLEAHGGRVKLSHEVRDLRELPPARVRVLDVTPRAALALAGDELPARYRRRLERFRYGQGAAKVDFALSQPVPWRDDVLRSAPTLHLGGSRAELAAGEREVARGRHPSSPYVLASQPSLVDPTRAPEGRHTLWTYTHVPAGSDLDRAEAVTSQIERFAPGFRDTVLAVSSRTAVDLEHHNPNYPGGDIAAGAADLAQLFARPVLSPTPWRTPARGLYLCSSSTAPGPGVHGLAGWYAARTALRDEFGIRTAPDLSLAG
jgi:phytoene dehydrogenase-like protein